MQNDSDTVQNNSRQCKQTLFPVLNINRKLSAGSLDQQTLNKNDSKMSNWTIQAVET